MKRGEGDDRFLYRHVANDREHSVLVQSSTRPDWSFLNGEELPARVETKQFDPTNIIEGDRLRFYLKANPVVSRKYSEGKSRRIAVGSDRKKLANRLNLSDKDELPSREEMLLAWLQKKGDLGGFTLTKSDNGATLCEVGPNHDVVLRKNNGDAPITLTTVDFNGLLTVTDTESFRGTLRRGLGRGRAFGCGLMSVRRL